MRGVSYNWNKKSGIQDEGKQIGFIAQEVEKQYPEFVNTNKDSGLKSVNYAQFVSVLLEGMKEMSTNIDSMENEIKELKKDNKKIKEDNKKIKKDNKKIKKDNKKNTDESIKKYLQELKKNK